MINIFISNQKISTDVRKITANSINYLTACCHFDSSWVQTSKQIIFTNGDVSKAVMVSDGEEIAIPYEVLVPGKLELSAVGLENGGEKRITTRKMLLPITVCPSGALTGDTPDSYAPELWEQAYAKIGDLNNLNIKADNLVSAINAVGKSQSTADTSASAPTSGGAGAWRLLKTVTVGDDVSAVDIRQDEDGNAISCRELRLVILMSQVNSALSLYFSETPENTINRPFVTVSQNVKNQTVTGYFTKLGGYVGSSQTREMRPYVGGYNFELLAGNPVEDGNMSGLYITSATWNNQKIWPGTVIYLFGR